MRSAGAWLQDLKNHLQTGIFLNKKGRVLSDLPLFCQPFFIQEVLTEHSSLYFDLDKIHIPNVNAIARNQMAPLHD